MRAGDIANVEGRSLRARMESQRGGFGGGWEKTDPHMMSVSGELGATITHKNRGEGTKKRKT